MDDRDDGDNRQLAEQSDFAADTDGSEGEPGSIGGERQVRQEDTSDLAGMEDSERVDDPYEGAVPPGYDWPTHGGYLGCLMGVVAAVIVALLLTAPVLYFADLPQAAVWLLRVVVFVACVIGGGRLGWALGKRFYREYPHERPTWGEDDSAEIEGTQVEDPSDEAKARD